MEDRMEYTVEYETQEAYDYEAIAKKSSQYRLQKLLGWLVRTVIATILFVTFWEYTWVKWTLVFYIPLNIFGLYSIVKSFNAVDAKVEEVIQKIEELEAIIAAEEEE